MKKPQIAILAVTAAFLCIIFGIFIGRNLLPNYYMPHYNDTTYAGQEITEEIGKININTATADQLTQLPGIGPTIAERIIEYRTANGEFASIFDLLDVKGVGEQTFRDISDMITTGG